MPLSSVSAEKTLSAAKDLIRRTVPEIADRFEVEIISRVKEKEVFEIENKNGKIILRGDNGVSVSSALNYYLERYCNCSITWNGDQLRLPDTLPVIKGKVHRETPFSYRYYLNYVSFNYTMVWWDWERWQREIDWMALHGINLLLALTGEEAIWQEVYRSLGFGEKELTDFFTGPAYSSWLWMGNIDGWGGPLPQNWIDDHKKLQKRILQRVRALGMTPVLPAFTGHVPPSFKERFPKARVKKTNWGWGFKDVLILDAEDPLFEKIGCLFLEKQEVEYGTDHLYSADTFNENIPPTADEGFLKGISKRIFDNMLRSDPQAKWVMQGWMFSYNYRFWQPERIQALLSPVPDDRMIILDLWSETNPVWNRTDGFFGKPWIWCLLQNFGGNTGLFGRMRHVAFDPGIAFHDPDAGKMIGVGITPEGMEQNPALFQLMVENIWRTEPIDIDKWLSRYAERRYGGRNKKLEKAWIILKNTVYSGGKTEGSPQSIITGRPTFNHYAAWTNTNLYYDPSKLIQAWDLFTDCTHIFRENEGFQYDLVDITRQVLANYAMPLQLKFVAAWEEQDIEAFRKNSNAFINLISDLDELLGSRKDFLLGRWIADARKWGKTKEESDLYEFNARDLITLWGDKDSPLHEYACRQWSGLLNDFYKPRWEMFFKEVLIALENHTPFLIERFEPMIKEWEWQWVNSVQTYPVEPKGHPIKIVLNLYEKYRYLLEKEYYESMERISD